MIYRSFALLLQSEQVGGIFPSDFLVGLFGDESLFSYFFEVRHDGQLLGDIGDICAPVETVLELLHEPVSELGIARDGVVSAAGGEVPMKVGILAHQLYHAALSSDRPLWVAETNVWAFQWSNLDPECFRVCEDDQAGAFLEHFLEARKARVIVAAVAAAYFRCDVKRQGEADLLHLFEEIEVEHNSQQFVIRTETSGNSGKAFQAVKVGLPPVIREEKIRGTTLF